MKLNRSESDTNSKGNGTWQRIKKPLLIAIFALIVLVSYIFYAETTGIFPGALMNRPAVSDYLEEQYPNTEFDITFKEFDKVRERYVYACTTETGTYLVTSKRFTVREDGYYRDFICSDGLSETVGQILENDLIALWESVEGSTIVPEVSMAIPETKENTEAAAEALLLRYGDTVKLTATITGNSISYEDYVQLAWKIMCQVRETLPNIRVDFIQVFYYRDGNVLQYESHLQGYSLMYNETGFLQASNAHYYVELTEDHEESLKWYSVIRIVNFVVIGGTVIGLGTLWIVRYRKKKKKEFAQKNQNL